jgi:hypothetical protein
MHVSNRKDSGYISLMPSCRCILKEVYYMHSGWNISPIIKIGIFRDHKMYTKNSSSIFAKTS